MAGPAGATQQGGLDHVVAEDVTAERTLAFQVRQARGLGEGLGAQDGVVAPVEPSEPVHQARPAAATRLHRRTLNCDTRANRVEALTMTGAVWIRPMRGLRPWRRPDGRVSPAIVESASSTTMNS